MQTMGRGAGRQGLSLPGEQEGAEAGSSVLETFPHGVGQITPRADHMGSGVPNHGMPLFLFLVDADRQTVYNKVGRSWFWSRILP